MADSRKVFEKRGFVLIKRVISDQLVARFRNELSDFGSAESVSQKDKSIYGVRNLLGFSKNLRSFASSRTVTKLLKQFSLNNAKPVRAIYFNKSADANWKVPWHQDLTIAVKKRKETKGYSPWSIKAGIQHVQPPGNVMANIIALRFHLDDADETNGALKVLEGTHRYGRLSASEIANLKTKANTKLCEASKGDVLIMRPYLVHSSSAGTKPGNRRVIHIEYSNQRLPNGLDWYGC